MEHYLWAAVACLATLYTGFLVGTTRVPDINDAKQYWATYSVFVVASIMTVYYSCRVLRESLHAIGWM